MSNEDPTFKNTVKEWLKSSKKDRRWLAEQCCVGKRAVDKWLSTARGIPAAKVALIKHLMGKPMNDEFANPPGLPAKERTNKLFVTLDPGKQDILEMQAHMNGMSLSAYCSLILERATEHEDEFLDDILATFEKKWKESDGEK